MKRLGFIGAGNMAEALARGLIANKVFKPAELVASDVDAGRRRRFKTALRVETTTDNLAVLSAARAVLLAVKPQTIDEVLRELASAQTASSNETRGGPKRAAAGKLFISIAAGVTLARLEGALGARARVIRVMPNAPAMVGQGMAALVRGRHATRADEVFALRIFRAVGDAVALKDEALLDTVTALSGSGPAYVYLFVKALTDAAAAEGLPAELALRMALKTVRGAEENMRRSPLSAAELIRIVASPGGTTEAALKRLDGAGFSAIVADAVHAAAARSRELGRIS
ncbi:MAG TPA: pyrroline-5-carboxylate reductase [Candidatus Binataceae bacterium]|jgi:pyrroline-5-carboxylate reductase|nr:pyrroline-5-carboxylate reductase [Candidatus Binataceae bacterium]